SLIIDLERKTQELKSELDRAETERIKYMGLNEVYQSKVKTLEKELKEIKSRAIHEAELIVQRANSTIERTVREIREKGADRNVVRNAREEISGLSVEMGRLKSELMPEENREHAVQQ